MTEDAQAQYFHYLKTRGRLAWLYRKFYLYPRLCDHLHGTVADVGCGIGDFLRYRPQTIGFDVNDLAVQFCQSLGLQAHPMTPKTIPAENHSFDGVVLDNVLEHLEDPGVLISELARVLKPTGSLLIGVPGAKGYRADPDHQRFYDEAQLTTLMTSVGFSLVRMMRMPLDLRLLSEHLTQYCIYGVFRLR